MKLAQLLSVLGPKFVIDPVRDRLHEGVLRPEGLTPELARLVAAMMAANPALHAHLRELRDNHLLGDEIIRGVLEYMREAGDAQASGQVAELALFLGIKPPTPPQPSGDVGTLTASQQAAFREIVALSEIYFAGGLDHAGVNLRIAPLVIGPSGVGKTHLVMAVGRALGLPIVRMTVSDWIIQAARQTPSALTVLQAKLKENQKFILFIDELDKLSKSSDGGAYTLFQQVEIYAVLDRAVSYPGGQWGSEQDRQLRENVMIVGGGTWHDLWTAGPQRSMGFGSAAAATDDIANKIRQARIIPEELLNRFSDRWLLLRPYTPEDFQVIAERIGLAPEDFDPVAAAASGGNFRAIQNAVTARELKRHFAKEERGSSLNPTRDPA
jgi:hypothetical protein